LLSGTTTQWNGQWEATFALVASPTGCKRAVAQNAELERAVTCYPLAANHPLITSGRVRRCRTHQEDRSNPVAGWLASVRDARSLQHLPVPPAANTGPTRSQRSTRRGQGARGPACSHNRQRHTLACASEEWGGRTLPVFSATSTTTCRSAQLCAEHLPAEQSEQQERDLGDAQHAKGAALWCLGLEGDPLGLLIISSKNLISIGWSARMRFPCIRHRPLARRAKRLPSKFLLRS
jgi:hypothetical protein